MSNSRIEVVYSTGPNVGQTRWLDPEAGELFLSEHSTLAVSRHYAPCPVDWGPRGWSNALARVTEVVRAPEAPPPPKPDPQAFKADDGKPNWMLLMGVKGCAKALAGVVRVLSFAVRSKDKGGKGYVEHSWREVPGAKERYEAALMRHLAAVKTGELVDPESNESHWYHIATNALFLAELHNEEPK